MIQSEVITIIFFSFSIGSLLGALWMFFALQKTIKKIEQELDSKNKQLEKLEIDGLQEYYNSI
tara:strand:- start:2170 stop:2358 length:189 start_codon:yes stop_codon:yes gene_type:complete